MARHNTTVGYTPTRSARRRPLLAAVLVVGMLVLIGAAFLLGRVTASAPTAAANPAGGLPMRDGIPVPGRHSVAGAATAAGDYQVAGFRVSAGTLDPAAAVAVLLAPQATSAAQQVLAAPTAPAAQLAKARTSYAPLSLVVRDYTAGKAVVQVWGVAATSTQVTPQPAGTEDWGSSTVSLAWDGSQWRVTDQQFSDGPWPAPADQRLAASSGDFSFRYSELIQDGWTYVPES
jgi:hypothetical protein